MYNVRKERNSKDQEHEWKYAAEGVCGGHGWVSVTSRKFQKPGM